MAARRGVWLVFSLILLAVAISMSGVAASYFLFNRGPSVPSRTTLELRLTGDVAEVPGGDILEQFMPEQPTVRGIVETLRRAKTDPRVSHLIVRPTGSGAFWGKTQEIRDAILDFRKSGKKTVAFLEFGGDQEYYLATACERVFLLPTSSLDLKGLATYEVFLRGTLDKVGAVPDLLHIGDYKTAVNTFTEKTFTPAHREMTESLNRDTFDQLVQGIATARKKTADEVRALIDQGPFNPEDALSAGLVDDLAYLDEVDEKAKLGDLTRTELDDYTRAAGQGMRFGRGDRIAVIYAVGTISSGRSGEGPDGTYAGSDTLAEYIQEAKDDPTIKAVVLRVDSPGGSSVASDVIWRELMLLKEEKPLVVSMGDLAASGGYYIAMAGHHIVAEPGTLTGSIGIFSGKFVTGGTFQKLGANVESVSSGKFADMNSPVRPYNAAERAKVEEQMQHFYDQFVEKVAQSRKSTPARIDAVAQGRVWTGRQAREIGLVDSLGGLSTAIDAAKDRAKIPANREVQTVVFPPRRSFFEVLSEPFGSSTDEGATSSMSTESLASQAFLRMLKPAERRALAELTAPFRLLQRAEPLALMPYVFLR